jgi:predicted RNase H-like HicB family nuclease
MTTTPAPKEETRSGGVAAINREGIWVELTSYEGLQQVIFQRPLPLRLLRDYAELAVRHANVVQEDGGWLATIEGFPGVWAKESSQKEALDVLEEVVFEWVLLKIHDEDRDLPVLGSLDLNTL